MAIITAAGLSGPYDQMTFNKNGSILTLKKISETDWLMFGDVVEGDSEGFGVGSPDSSNMWFMMYSDQVWQSFPFDGDVGIEGIELSTQVGTTRSVYFIPQDDVAMPPNPEEWFLRFDLRDDNGDYPGNTMIVRYGDGSEETYPLDTSYNFTEVVHRGGIVEMEIKSHQSGIPITGELYRLSWSAPY